MIEAFHDVGSLSPYDAATANQMSYSARRVNTRPSKADVGTNRARSEKNSWGRLESRRACFATRMAPIASGCLEIPDMAAFQELMQADPSWEATRADGVSRRYGGVPRGGVTRHRLSVRPRTALTFKA